MSGTHGEPAPVGAWRVIAAAAVGGAAALGYGVGVIWVLPRVMQFQRVALAGGKPWLYSWSAPDLLVGTTIAWLAAVVEITVLPRLRPVPPTPPRPRWWTAAWGASMLVLLAVGVGGATVADALAGRQGPLLSVRFSALVPAVLLVGTVFLWFPIPGQQAGSRIPVRAAFYAGLLYAAMAGSPPPYATHGPLGEAMGAYRAWTGIWALIAGTSLARVGAQITSRAAGLGTPTEPAPGRDRQVGAGRS